MSKGPDAPETPKYEIIQRENAVKNLSFANDLHDRNFDAMKNSITRDTGTTKAGMNNADLAKAASKRKRDPKNPLTMVAGDAKESLAMEDVSRVMDDASGDRVMVQQGEKERKSANNILTGLSRRGHNESRRKSAKEHSTFMSDIDTFGAAAGGAYYATEGFTTNPLAEKEVEKDYSHADDYMWFDPEVQSRVRNNR